MAESIGTISYDARINLNDLIADSKRADRIASSTGDKFEDSGKRGSTSFVKMGAVIGAVAGAVQSLATRAIDSLTASIGGAIARVDTLNNSKRTFENMGFNADQTKQAIGDLDKSIRGLPTPLDQAIRGMTALAATYGDVGLGQKVFTALNNAILGFGGTADEVNNAILQISQLPMDGPLDAATWNSLRNSGLTPVLVAMSKDMGISVGEMKRQFGEGQLKVEDFIKALIKMDKEGGGGLKSLEKIARDSTSGMATGFANAQTAVTRGIAKIIEAIGSKNISETITNIGKALEVSLASVAVVFGTIKTIVDQVSPIVATFFNDLANALKPVVDFIVSNKQAWEGLKVALIAIAAAIGVTVVAIGVGLVLAFAVLQIVINVVTAQVEFFTKVFNTVNDMLATGIRTVVSFTDSLANNFTNAVNTVVGLLSGLLNFFGGFWSSVTSIFGRVGTVVGDAIGNAFRSVINSIIGSAANIINGFIDAINNVVGVIDAIPGVDIGRIGRLPVPQLATGGIVSSPTLAMIGEGRESEAVIPLSKLDDMLNGDTGRPGNVQVTINMAGIMSRSKADERDIARNLVRRLNEDLQAKGYDPIGGGAI